MFAVIGANGFLGSYIVKYIIENTDEKLIATSKHAEKAKCFYDRVRWRYCDVQRDASVDELLRELRENDSVKVIYLAAYHHPEEVEIHKELAWDINVTSLSRFVNKIDFADVFYYISTDVVYGDSIDSYHFKENDLLKPVNFYGHCKCAAEAITVHLGRNIVRLPFLISPSLAGKKHFYDKIVDELKHGRKVEMFLDSLRSTIGFDQAAKLIVELMMTDSNHNYPVVNVCGDDALSKYDVGLMIAKREHLDPNLIVPMLAEDHKEWNQVNRAHSTLMDNSLLKTVLNIDKIHLFEDITFLQGKKKELQAK